jgi:hypothetical protein
MKISKHLEDEHNRNNITFENKMKEITNLEMRIAQGLD